jgi:hypothetical protein
MLRLDGLLILFTPRKRRNDDDQVRWKRVITESNRSDIATEAEAWLTFDGGVADLGIDQKVDNEQILGNFAGIYMESIGT